MRRRRRRRSTYERFKFEFRTDLFCIRVSRILIFLHFFPCPSHATLRQPCLPNFQPRRFHSGKTLNCAFRRRTWKKAASLCCRVYSFFLGHGTELQQRTLLGGISSTAKTTTAAASGGKRPFQIRQKTFPFLSLPPRLCAASRILDAKSFFPHPTFPLSVRARSFGALARIHCYECYINRTRLGCLAKAIFTTVSPVPCRRAKSNPLCISPLWSQSHASQNLDGEPHPNRSLPNLREIFLALEISFVSLAAFQCVGFSP